MNEREIFLAALQKPDAAARAAFLDQECAEPNLRRQIDALLAEHDQLGSFLEAPAAALPSPLGGEGSVLPSPPLRGRGAGGEGVGPTVGAEASAERPGAIIGPYKLLEQIGEGGMGTVWMAQQTEPVKRVVALKLIKAGMDSKQVIARFEAERQALALMDHPNIAKVFDGGMISHKPEAPAKADTPIPSLALRACVGRPYFVMELVKGMPITKYCDEHRLTPRQRLELFIPVCQAVQHAHQKGIIHRDLKPSNVLVALYDGKPVPKVIDFGVAKAAGQSLTEKTLVTGFGNIVGTLEYMSPEQAEVNQLDIDTRSDIYSLGVLLYELLTGSPPFTRKELEKAGMLEMLRVIREQEPSKPSTKLSTADGLPTLAANRGTEPAKLTKLVRGELDWIVMKALEKDRNRRYETANGFAQDVQRYLADEAVLACPPSVGYRLKKFARRNKVALAFTGLVLLILLTLTGGIGWNVRDRAAREAEAARHQAERQAKLAGQVESIFAEVDRLEGEQKWPEALTAARRAEAAAAAGEADAETTKQARQRLKDLEFIDRLEQIRMQRATIVEGKFDNAGADREYARAFRNYGVNVEELPVRTLIDGLKARSALAIPLAAALDDWVYARRQVSEKDAAGWKQLVAVARGIDPEPMRDRLRSTWGQPISEIQDELRRLAESINVRAQHPVTLITLARSLTRGKPSDSALRILRDAQHVYPGDFWLNFECGDALLTQKDYEGAIRFYTAAVAIRPNSIAALNNLGAALERQKKPEPDEAIRCYRKAIELQPKFARAYENLARAFAGQDRLDDAIALLLKALELNPDDADALNTSAWSLNAVAWVLATHADPARRDRSRAVALATKAVEHAPNSEMAWQYLGWIHYRTGNWKSSIEALEKSCRLQLRPGSTGDAGQWIVLALAHAKLSSQEDLPEKERAHHNSQARRWYDQAVKQIDYWWRVRPDYDPGQGIWDFRVEARELLGVKEKKN